MKMAAIPERLSLFKRSGTYHLLYYLGGKRRWKSTYVSTRPEALKKLTELRELLHKRAHTVYLSKFILLDPGGRVRSNQAATLVAVDP